jgi:hypothetical protein
MQFTSNILFALVTRKGERERERSLGVQVNRARETNGEGEGGAGEGGCGVKQSNRESDHLPSFERVVSS